MIRIPLRPGVPVVLAALALATGPGCATYYEDMNAQQVRQQEDLRAIREQIQRLSGRIEGIEMETQRLATDLEAVRSLASSAGESQGRLVQGQVQELGTRIRQLEAARESDRQAIVDDISRRVAEMLKRSSAGSSSGASRSTTPVRRSSSSTGYEHVVKAGETLSAIAAAYGVTQSVIAQENGISDPSKVRVGQKLFIPEK
ncbi:MAG: LysM peptidoglycan-binding domain-containing protein [Lentisphaerae bacterium]|nr:LysM peptidoglycan-binding domain-containing protein [Lentisphaerota bacterium]